MIKFIGKSVCRGITQGQLVYFKRSSYTIRHSLVSNVEAELSRFNIALKVTEGELETLYQKALGQLGRDDAEIFRAHQAVLNDEEYVKDVRSLIEKDSVNAEYAVQTVANTYAAIFAGMEDALFRSKAQDVYDVTDRIIRILNNTKEDVVRLDTESVLIADDLTPSELVNLDKSKLLGIVLFEGTPHSHVAIISRSLNIPTIIGIGHSEEIDRHLYKTGDTAIVDAYEGRVYINPTDEVKRQIELKLVSIEVEKLKLNSLKGLPNETISGKCVDIYANVGSLEEVDIALENDARGIGLFRTEFAFMNKTGYPTEEEQYAIYKAVIDRMQGKRVFFRTLDIGSDKPAKFMGMSGEANPAMGYRAVRISLRETAMFKTQVRAILRAAYQADAAFMVPMIISLDEVIRIKKLVTECRDELKKENIPFGEDTAFGIMIETPAAALISDKLAPEVDFFSIGTNDLTQYTLAIDRENNKLDEFLDTHHPALLKLIEITIFNAKMAGIEVGICGELASDLSLTRDFIKMGVDGFSVYPSMILPLRSKIRGLNV